MSSGPGDALLHNRRVTAGAEHDVVMVCLQDQGGTFPKQVAHSCRGAPEVVGDAEHRAAGSHYDGERLSCIVTGGAGFNPEWSDFDRIAHPYGLMRGVVGKTSPQRSPGSSRRENRELPLPTEPGSTLGVVSMFMSEDESGDIRQRQTDQVGAPFYFPAAESRVDQQHRSLCPDGEAVAF
jgi:hypothetical protein